MKIPTVPAALSLSPQPPEPEVEPQQQSLSIKDRLFGTRSSTSGERRVSIGSAPTSPAFQRKMAMSMVLETGTGSSDLRPGNLAGHQMLSSSLTSFDRAAIDEEYNDEDQEDHENQGNINLPFVGRTSYFQRFSQTRLSHREQGTSRLKSKSVRHANPAAVIPIETQNQGQDKERQVCQDCKEMVLQVVRAQSTARRLQFAKSLFQQEPESNTKA